MTQTVSFIGALLKAIASTPNHNQDDADYNQRVLEPTRRLRKVEQELGEQSPSHQQMGELLATLAGILAAKQVDANEQQERLQEIAAQFGIAQPAAGSHGSH